MTEATDTPRRSRQPEGDCRAISERLGATGTGGFTNADLIAKARRSHAAATAVGEGDYLALYLANALEAAGTALGEALGQLKVALAPFKPIGSRVVAQDVYDRLTAQAEPPETTGFVEPVDTPRPPASTGAWDDVWERQSGKVECDGCDTGCDACRDQPFRPRGG